MLAGGVEGLRLWLRLKPGCKQGCWGRSGFGGWKAINGLLVSGWATSG